MGFGEGEMELEGVAGRRVENGVFGERRERKEGDGDEKLGLGFWGIRVRVLEGKGEEREQSFRGIVALCVE